jgi:K+-sensing histidine kinase KdpD
MDGIDWVYLLLGIGIGVVGSRVVRSPEKPPASSVSAPQQTHPQDDPSLQEELKQTQLAYQMAREMSQFKSGFLARTSHELRSPLSSLIGMHQLILSDLCDNPEEEREFVAQANASALKMVKLLDEIIGVAKTEHGTAQLETRPLQLAEVFEEVHQLTYMQAANRNFQLHVIAPDPDLYVLSDARRLRQVLVALVDTAISQMESGSIHVSAAASPTSESVQIWVDSSCPSHVWSDPVDLLASASELKLYPPGSFPESSPGFTLLIARALVEVMQGRLEIVPASEDTAEANKSENLTRIQCTIPLSRDETVEQGLAEG